MMMSMGLHKVDHISEQANCNVIYIKNCFVIFQIFYSNYNTTLVPTMLYFFKQASTSAQISIVPEWTADSSILLKP